MPPADSPFAPLPPPGPHPATAELRAYAAGTLPPAEQHRLEAHALECERCADLLAGFSLTHAAATDQAIAALRSRLQTRLLDTPASPQSLPRLGWPHLAAAAAVLGVVATGIWALEKHDATPGSTVVRHTTGRRQVASAPAPHREAPAQFVPPAASVPPAPDTQPTALYAGTTVPVHKARSRHFAATRAHHQDYAQRKRREGVKKISSNQSPLSALANAQTTTADTTRADSVLITAREASLSPARGDASTPRKPTSSDSLASAVRPVAAKTEISAGAAQVTASPLPTAPAINPAPVGGSAALRDYLRREAARFDPEVNASRISGAVRLQFVVGADGKLNNMQVIRGLRADYDAEALRILCDGPAWQPGVAGGRRAPLPVEITILF